MPEYTPDQFAAILLKAAAETPREAVQVVGRGASNVKTEAKANVLQTAPIHNAGAHKAITYDDPAVVDAVVSSEIGYDKNLRGGPLGNLLEYGGGDHSPAHRDLGRAMDVEEPRFEQAMADMGERLLEG